MPLPPLQTAVQSGLAYNAPEYQRAQQQSQSLIGQIGAQQKLYGVNQAQLQNTYRGNLSDINTQRAQGLVDFMAAGRQIPYYNQLSGLADQSLAQDQAYYSQLGGLATKQLQGDVGYYNQLGGLADQMLASQLKGFGVQDDASRLAAEREQYGLMSDVVGKGALTTPGTRTQRGFIDRDLYNNLSAIMENKNQAAIGNVKEKTGYEKAKSDAALSTEKELAGYTRATNQAITDTAKTKLGYAEQQAQARDQQQRLLLESQNLGVKKDVLQKNLSLGLKELGIHNWMSVNDLMDGLNSVNYQTQTLSRGIINDALSYADAASSLGGANKKAKPKPTGPPVPFTAAGAKANPVLSLISQPSPTKAKTQLISPSFLGG